MSAETANLLRMELETSDRLRGYWLETQSLLNAAATRLEQQAKELDEARAELAANEQTRTAMRSILDRTVDALHGSNPPNLLRSWHDIPELIAKVMSDRDAAIRERDEARAELAEALSHEGAKDKELDDLYAYLHWDEATQSHPDWVALAQSAESDRDALRTLIYAHNIMCDGRVEATRGLLWTWTPDTYRILVAPAAAAPEAGPKPDYCKCLTPNPAPFNREWCYCCGRTLRAVEQQSPAQPEEGK